MTSTIRVALERLVELHNVDGAWGMHWDDAIAAARAALAAEPVGDGYDREGEIAAVILDHSYVDPDRNLSRVLREWDFGATARAILARRSRPAAPPAPLPTHDLSNAAPLLWLLWNHLGGESPVGRPIREYLGMGQFESMSDAQIVAAKQYADCKTCQGLDGRAAVEVAK